MGESILYRDLQSQQLIEQYRAQLKSFKTRIALFTTFTIILLVLTLMFNKVGLKAKDINSEIDRDFLIQDEQLCSIGLNQWYILFTCTMAIKLLITTIRY